MEPKPQSRYDDANLARYGIVGTAATGPTILPKRLAVLVVDTGEMLVVQ
jgi:hypothetical protein